MRSDFSLDSRTDTEKKKRPARSPPKNTTRPTRTAQFPVTLFGRTHNDRDPQNAQRLPRRCFCDRRAPPPPPPPPSRAPWRQRGWSGATPTKGGRKTAPTRRTRGGRRRPPPTPASDSVSPAERRCARLLSAVMERSIVRANERALNVSYTIPGSCFVMLVCFLRGGGDDSCSGTDGSQVKKQRPTRTRRHKLFTVVISLVDPPPVLYSQKPVHSAGLVCSPLLSPLPTPLRSNSPAAELLRASTPSVEICSPIPEPGVGACLLLLQLRSP